MNILFISTSIPPFPDMQSIRNLYLIKGLSVNNNITIITPNYKWNNDRLEDELSNIARIIKTKPPIFIRIEKFVNSRCSHFIRRIYNVASHYFTFPDNFMFWNYYVKKIVNCLLIQETFDGVITSSGSYTAHFVGKYISKKYSIPWIAEYGDPWSLDSNGKIKKIHFIFESNILKYCSGLIFTTKETINLYNQISPKNTPLHLCPCGFDKVIEDSSTSIKSNSITILYTGVAYSGSRNLLNAILSVIEINSNVELKIVGSFSQSYKDETVKIANGKISFIGRVDYETSLNYISKSDILLHIGNKGVMQVPGKTYIYLSSKKPIIYIQQEESHDPTLEILKKFKGIIICKNSQESITSAINEVLSNYAEFKSQSENRIQNIENYQWDNIALNYTSFIEKRICEFKS